MDLTLLAPDIQEQILFAEALDGKEPVSERGVRAVAHKRSWRDQWVVWNRCAF